jgi:hypothetical protein
MKTRREGELVRLTEKVPDLGGMPVGTRGTVVHVYADGAADRTADEPRLPRDESSSLTWLGDVYSLVAQGRFEAAIDVLFRNVDALLLAGQFSRCNELLRAIDLKRLDTNLLVGALSITVSAADRLPGRAHFVERVARQLEVLAPGRVERLLAGLR